MIEHSRRDFFASLAAAPVAVIARPANHKVSVSPDVVCDAFALMGVLKPGQFPSKVNLEYGQRIAEQMPSHPKISPAHWLAWAMWPTYREDRIPDMIDYLANGGAIAEHPLL